MKRVSSDNEKEFTVEDNALYKIRSFKHKHLIEVIDSFKRGSHYFFFFPWADGGDLKHFWETYQWTDGSMTLDMIGWVLEQIKGITSGVRKMHNPCEDQKSDQPPMQFTSEVQNDNGCHGDLKPKNILRYHDETKDNQLGTLCISDAGLARFYEQVTSKRVPGSSMKYGTVEYAPPEFDRPGSIKRSRKYDMWSLGCIFLEFITWVLKGNHGVVQLRKARTPPECTPSQTPSQSVPFYRRITDNYGFQTYRIHPTIKPWITSLLDHPKCRGDTWFRDVLEIIEKDLLVVETRDRMRSSDLDVRLKDIIEKTTKNKSYLCGPSNPAVNLQGKPVKSPTCCIMF